jgi:hypothetical protein
MISGVDMVLARVESEPQTLVKAVQPTPIMNTRPFSVAMDAIKTRGLKALQWHAHGIEP